MKPRIVITAGDPAGIGPEIVAAAMRDPEIRSLCEPIVIGDPVAFALHKEALPKVEMVSAPGLRKDLPLGRPSLEAGKSAVEAMRVGVGLIQARQAQALVTAPVSKESLHLAKAGAIGQTEWLAKETKSSSVAMLMLAEPLRALLMTRHVPLVGVSRKLTAAVLLESARLAYDFAKRTLKKSQPRIVLCGLNPHAGDQGLIGQEELKIMQPALKALRKAGRLIYGPLPADTVFPKMAQGHYDLALAAYHDQGMIPLKLYAGDRLVNLTLGLPFIRTAPGHGTAYDIAGKKQADARPFKEAIRLAVKYSHSS